MFIIAFVVVVVVVVVVVSFKPKTATQLTRNIPLFAPTTFLLSSGSDVDCAVGAAATLTYLAAQRVPNFVRLLYCLSACPLSLALLMLLRALEIVGFVFVFVTGGLPHLIKCTAIFFVPFFGLEIQKYLQDILLKITLEKDTFILVSKLLPKTKGFFFPCLVFF